MASRAMEHEFVVHKADKTASAFTPSSSTTTGSVLTSASSCRTSTSLSANGEEFGYSSGRSAISRIAQELTHRSAHVSAGESESPFCVFNSIQTLLLGGCGAPGPSPHAVLRRASREPIAEEMGNECMVAYQFDRLEHVGDVGRGSFGSVTLVRCNVTGQTLALKTLSKGLIVKKNMEEKVNNEKRVMQQASSPFIIKLAACFNRDEHLYFLMEAAMGGDLFNVYTKNDLFGSQEHARFYIGCVASGVHHLHQQSIIYRDLKLENVVLDSRGYAKLCDFGLAKFIPKSDVFSDMLQPSLTRAYTTCGTPEYMAPEIVGKNGYSFAADWWAMGVFAYEIITGKTPFAAPKARDILLKAKAGIDQVQFPATAHWPELIRGLCKRNPHERLPVTAGGMSALRELSWFRKAGFDWDALENCKMEAPFIPTVESPGDMSNFDTSDLDKLHDVPYVDSASGWDSKFEDVVGPLVADQSELVIDLGDMYL